MSDHRRILDTSCCHADAHFVVRVQVRAPSMYFRALSKGALRSRHVEIGFVSWEETMWQCDGCGRMWKPGEWPD